MYFEESLQIISTIWHVFFSLLHLINSYYFKVRSQSAQSVPIITKAMSLNPAHGEIYSIQHCVVHFVSDLRQVSGFIRVLRFSFTNKIDHHDITEILLKVV